MQYYLIREIETNIYAKGKATSGYKVRTLRDSNQPPKLYSLGSARYVQTFQKNQYNRELEIIPVIMTLQKPI